MTISYSLEGKTALITGGRRGMGRAIALTLATAGADIIVCDRVTDTGELAAVAEEVKKIGRRSLAVHADISHKADVDNLFQKAADFGDIDILVNNAGTSVRAGLLDLHEEDWDDIMDINIKGVYLCSQVASRMMIERKKGGAIISIASVVGIQAGGLRPRQYKTSVYPVSKAGVISFTRMLARELGSHNIRVNCIAPGIFKTYFPDRYPGAPVMTDPKVAEMLSNLVPMGRVGEPEDIADVVLFLSCDASRYISGATIVVDGGMLA